MDKLCKCGYGNVHHKNPYLFSGDNSIENLIALCRKCHMKAECKIRKEFKEKINIKIQVGDLLL